MSRTVYMEEASFDLNYNFNPWQVNVLWGRYIEKLHQESLTVAAGERYKYSDIGHLEEYRFVAIDTAISDKGIWGVYIDTDFEDHCVGGLLLAKFIATVIQGETFLEFYDDMSKRWGWHVTPGVVRRTEFCSKPGEVVHDAREEKQ